MSATGAALDRLSRDYGATLAERSSAGPSGGWVVVREWIPRPDVTGENSPWSARYSGTGSAQTKKAAKKLADEDLFRQLPAPGTGNATANDRLRLLMEKCNNNVVLRGESKGRKLPQLWKFDVFVNDNTEPSGTSIWLRRGGAMRTALEQACHKLGLLDGPPSEQDAFLIDISDDDNDDATAIPTGVDRGDIKQDVVGIRGESSGVKGDVRQPVRGGLPPDDNHVSMYQYLCSQHENVTFKVESRGASANSSWKFDIFVSDGVTPVASSDYLPRKVAKIQALKRACQALGHSAVHGDTLGHRDVGEEVRGTSPGARDLKRRRSESPTSSAANKIPRRDD